MYNSTNTRHTSRSALRVAMVAFTFALIAAACTSDGNDTINLGQDGLAPSGGSSVEAQETETPEVFGDRVDFEYEGFDGAELNFAELNDGPVVINFFASWCPTCIAELPDFQKVSESLSEEVTFLGLSVTDQPEASLELLAETGVTFPTGLDIPGDIFSAFGGLGMPTTVFINADGQVTDVHTGVLDEDSLTEAIQTELLS